ncbi:hydroxypyruvate isomerase family protein [Thalassoroseus pseudoceratinae]|uniref:hydroxypyruvate isomerase family protein n=1 Tax=Thalassoroseus pseudoceratinae TaxID=2713176 RepID=UPI001423D199|nr:TIM barrel protein [Thalassoroseus pseudoceratinae]
MADHPDNKLSRRAILTRTTGAALAGAFATRASAEDKKALQVRPDTTLIDDSGSSKLKGRIKQSVVQWCFSEHWDMEKTAQVAKQLGCQSVELVAPEHWPMLKKYGLTCAIASVDMSPDPPFVKGFNNPEHYPKLLKATRDAIEAAAAHGVPNVICFTGMAEDISREQGLKNCVSGLKKVIGLAEKKGITLCLEMLNTRDDSHPMKGHPGYQGDDIDYCADICRGVGSERMKLLFDIYHVQIMNGDVIRRIEQLKNLIGHVHTAGNPGRKELDETQEIYYPPIMQKLIDIGYEGYVGQEFIPTGDPLAGLKQAVELCDV